MATDGIGASVRRKEDYRFITGGGPTPTTSTGPGQVYAYFVRSPHAHARINGIDKSRAAAAPGVLAVLDRRRRQGGQLGRADLRLDGQVQGRLRHEGRAAPDPGPGQGALRRRPRRLRGRRDLPSGQGRGRAGRGRLRRAAGLRRDRACPRPGPAAGPRRHRAQHGLRVGARRPGGGRSGDRQRRPRHHGRAGQQPPGAERDRAARRDRRVRSRHRRLHALHHEPEPACRAAGDRGLRRRGARAQAARDRARRRRRLRLQDLHLRRGVRLPARRQEARPAGQVDRASAARASSPTRTAATTSPRPSWRWTPTATSPRSRSTPSPTWAPISRPSRRACRPTSTRRCSPGSTRRRRSIARSMRSTPTPRRSTPTAAPGGRRPPICSRRIVETAARETGRDPAELRRKNFIPKDAFPYQTPVALQYDTGDYEASLDKALELADYTELRRAGAPPRRPRASCAASASPATSRPAASRPRRWSARSAAASACGRAPRSASPTPASSRCSPAPTATARATRPPSPS